MIDLEGAARQWLPGFIWVIWVISIVGDTWALAHWPHE